MAKRSKKRPVRVLHFVRHGRYENPGPPEEGGGNLTGPGRQQARLTAAYLTRFPIKSITSSDLGRAVESAEIIAKKLKLKPRRTQALRETWPMGAKGKEQVATILERYFRPARSTRHEVYVAHGNLIRALVCRSLRTRLTIWMQLSTHNCGITTFRVHGDGSVSLRNYNDTAHLPSKHVTVN